MLKVSLSIENDLNLGLSADKDINLGLISDAVQVYATGEYEGSYDVVPTLEGFELETEGLTMTDDLTVEPIPINSAGNPQGGYTVVIG